MTPTLGLNEGAEIILGKNDGGSEKTRDLPTILVATIDPDIRAGLTDLFAGFSLNAIWLNTVEAAKEMLAKKKVTACLCSFWLQDGTYRELVRHIRRERLRAPLIIVSAPSCPNDYSEYLAAANLGTLNFLSHPYRRSELERMLRLAATVGSEILQNVVSPSYGAKEAA